MPHLRVKRRDDTKPVRCKARRYGPEQQAFLDSHVEQLEKAGLVYKNTRSRWCPPLLIVRKPEVNAFRMTVDVRVENAQTERMVWPKPMLGVVLDHLTGASVFFSLDFLQFKLDRESQEMFSFLTDQGVYTPTQALMGGSDSVANCEATVQAMHASKPNELLHWDFLAMPDGYLLVIQDDASKYLLLWETMTADAHSVVRAFLH